MNLGLAVGCLGLLLIAGILFRQARHQSQKELRQSRLKSVGLIRFDDRSHDTFNRPFKSLLEQTEQRSSNDRAEPVALVFRSLLPEVINTRFQTREILLFVLMIAGLGGGVVFILVMDMTLLKSLTLGGICGVSSAYTLLKSGGRYLEFAWRKRIDRQVAEVTEYLMLWVSAGVSFDNALIETENILKPYLPEISRELAILSKDLAYLPERKLAFEKLVDRTGSKGFAYLKETLLQGERLGTPIAKSLRAVAIENRRSDLMDREEKIRKIPVLISIPLMLLVLPPVVAIAVGPGFLQLIRAF